MVFFSGLCHCYSCVHNLHNIVPLLIFGNSHIFYGHNAIIPVELNPFSTRHLCRDVLQCRCRIEKYSAFLLASKDKCVDYVLVNINVFVLYWLINIFISIKIWLLPQNEAASTLFPPFWAGWSQNWSIPAKWQKWKPQLRPSAWFHTKISSSTLWLYRGKHSYG